MSKQENQEQTNQAIEDLTIDEAVQQEVKGGAISNNIKQMGIAVHSFNDSTK